MRDVVKTNNPSEGHSQNRSQFATLPARPPERFRKGNRGGGPKIQIDQNILISYIPLNLEIEMQKVLVTGGDGFIGSHVAEYFLNQGATVRIFDNLTARNGENIEYLKSLGQGSLEVVVGDIRSEADCAKACAGMEYVSHQAGMGSVGRSVEDPLKSHEINATGTLKMLIAARDAGVKRFVWASSSSVYGDQEPPDGPKYETMIPNPASPYGAAKLMGEHYARLFFDLYGFETVSLRYFNVFGPRQDPNSPYAAVIPKFIQWLRAEESPQVFGDGRQSRDFTYVTNVVQANVKAMTAPKAPGLVVNVANGTTFDLIYILNSLKKILGKDEVEPVFTDPRPGDVRHSLADVDRATNILGLEPDVDFDSGLGLTVEAYDF